jgi:hypothetical protein
MRTLAIRATDLVVVAVLVLAVAVVTLGGQPRVLTRHSGAVPDLECPLGVSPAQSFCYVPAAPKSIPDTRVPPSGP